MKVWGVAWAPDLLGTGQAFDLNQIFTAYSQNNKVLFAHRINNNNKILCFSRANSAAQFLPTKVCLVDPFSGIVSDLPIPAGYTPYFETFRINNLDQVVGTVQNATGTNFVPVIITNNSYTYLDPQAAPGVGNDMEVKGVNDLGTVVGLSFNFSSFGSAVRWQSGQTAEDLNLLISNNSAGCYLYEAIDINNNGVILASSTCGWVLLTPNP